MRNFHSLRVTTALVLWGLATSATAQQIERLSIIANGEPVGWVVATSDGKETKVDYHVDNNGRGPKHKEVISFGEDGLPNSWSVSGTSLMGGPVDERFTWNGGRATWRSQADSGAQLTKTAPLYVLNDGSPWADGIYVRAALASPGGAISVMPGGKAQVTRLREVEFTSSAGTEVGTVYLLSGLQLAPSYVVLDNAGKLFGTIDSDGQAAIRAGFEDSVPKLRGIISDLEMSRMRDLQRALGHNFTGPVRITNVHIYDPKTGTVGPLSSVTVVRDTITSIIPQSEGGAADDGTIIDGQGGTVFPGLHDMHSHATLASGLLYLAAGVTSTRDMGNNNAFMQDLLPRLASGELAGPRIVPNGFLEGRSPYSARYGFIPENIEQAKEYVRWYADRGYYEIKIYNSMNSEWVRPIAEEAHKRGLRVVGHIPAFTSPDRMIRDGYDAIAHVNQLMLGWILDPTEDTRTPLRLTAMARAGTLDLSSPRVQTTVRLMKEHHVALDPTAVILEQLMLSRANTVPSFAQDYFANMPIGFQRFRKRSYIDASSPEANQAYRSGFAKVLETLAMLHREGIQLLPGTDDGTGFTVHRELELYVMAGIPAADVMRIATLDMDRYLGQADRLGTIEKGKLADFVLVAGDPTKDIRAIKRPRMVLRGGTIYFPNEIYDAYGITPFSSAPPVRLPIDR